MAKKLYKKTGNNTYEIQGILPTETEWGKVVLTDTTQTIIGIKTFDVAYANVFATGTGEGNYFQCRKFRGEGDASTYYHALEFGYAGHNQWDFFEYGGIYNFYQNTTSDGSGKVNLFQISPDGVTSNKPLIAESTLTAKGAFTSSASTTLSHIKNAGILGTDSSGKVCDNSSKYQKAGDYATKSDLTKYQPAGSYQPKGDYVTYDNASKDVYLGSHGIYSGTRPSSSGATLIGNGYWIKPSYVGVSSAIVGGTVPSVSSEMTPDYISISNGKIKLNTSGIVSDSGTFKFDGNPGSVATSADINNLQTQLNAKLDKTTYEWNKEFAAGSNGAISLGRYNIYDSQLTFDITSTTNQSISGKLVIATQNGTIHQAKVFGDASGALVSKLIIYQSAISNSRSWVEVFCNFNGWSKNKVHIYAVALNSATVQKQMTSVTISNGVPAAANVTSGDTKWTGTIVNDFSHSHSNYVTTNTKQSITGQKTFDATPVLSKIKGAKVVGTNANGLIEAHTLGISDITNLQTQLNDKMPFEYHNSSYGIFYRDPSGFQYTGIDGDYRDMRMIATFDNTTNPHDSDPNIGSKMVDIGTVMSAGVDSDDPQNFGGAIFANFIGPNNHVGEYSDILRRASQVASDKFRETHGANLAGGFGCLAGTAKGSLFTSRIDSSTGDIYTSALMFKPNVDSNDPDFQGNMAIDMKMPCFSIYNGIQVTTSGPIYDRNDVIDPLRERNNYSVAFLAYSKTGRNVDIDSITEDYQPKGSYVTTNTEQTISSKKTFSTTPVLSALKNKKVLGTDANGLIEAHTLGISDITNLQSILNGKVNSDDLLKITGSSGFGDSNWHYRKIGHFIFNSSDSRNGAPVHISGVIGNWAQEKMIFDIFVCTRGGLKVNGFVRGINPSCRLVIDNTENPNIFLAVKGFATYNITVNTFENAKNENNAVRGSFHIDWTGRDDFTGSDVGVTATNFGYKDLLTRVAYQRAYYTYTGAFSETSGTMTKLCEVSGGETGKIICVHGQATSTNSELSIQRRASHYYDYDCIAVAPTGYNSGTYISCTGVVPPRLQYSTTGDTPVESTYYIFGKNVSGVYITMFDLP